VSSETSEGTPATRAMAGDMLAKDISHPRLRTLYGYWTDKRGGHAFPSRRDIDPIEMRDWLGNLLLIACEPGVRYRYIVYGTHFVEAFGIDLTGRWIDELPKDQHRLLAEEYDTIRMSGIPELRRYTARFGLFAAGKASPAEREMTWERLVLPLGGTRLSGTRELDPGRVALLLVGAYALDQDAL
jgi:hypothetical protein